METFNAHASIGHKIETPYGLATIEELHYDRNSSTAVFKLDDGRYAMSTERVGKTAWKLGTTLRRFGSDIPEEFHD